MPTTSSVDVRKMAPTITSLPNEILLKIASLLTQTRHQNRDLRNLALTCRRWGLIAQEVLICSPKLDAAQLPSYLYSLTRHPDLIPKVKSLQLWSELYSEEPTLRWHKVFGVYSSPTSILQWVRALRNPEDMEEETRVFSMRLKSAIQSVLQTSTYVNPLHDVSEWEIKLDSYVIPAIISLVLSVLTGLKELKLSGTHLDHARFIQIALRKLTNNADNCDEKCARQGSEFFTTSVLKLLMEKVEVFEHPMNLGYIWQRFTRVKPERLSHYGFSALKILSIPYRLLDSNMSVEKVFPKGLVCLRIMCASNYEEAWFARGLCSARHRGLFPHLKRLEVQYGLMFKVNVLQVIVPLSWHALPAICVDAGVELNLSWPQLWLSWPQKIWSDPSTQTVASYWKDNKQVTTKMEYSLGIPPRLEREWDAMGNVVKSSPNLP